MTTVTAKKAFKWDEKTTTAKAIELYLAKLNDTISGEPTADSIAAAANNDFLLSIAKEVGAVSEKSVRGKLTRENVYVKPEHVASVAKTSPVRKEHHVRALGSVLRLDSDEIDSLKNAKQCTLEAVTSGLGITNIEEASAAGYSPRPEMLVMQFAAKLGLDMDDLDVYREELAEAAEAEKAA